MTEEAPSTKADDPSDDSVLVVRESRGQRDFLYGFLCVAFAAALARTLTGSNPPVALVVIFAVILALLLALWWFVRRHPAHIEVSADRIRFITKGAKETTKDGEPLDPDFVRADGDEVQFGTKSGGGQYRYSYLTLTQLGTPRTWELRFFNQKPVADACRQRGWRVTG